MPGKTRSSSGDPSACGLSWEAGGPEASLVSRSSGERIHPGDGEGAVGGNRGRRWWLRSQEQRGPLDKGGAVGTPLGLRQWSRVAVRWERA